MEKVLCVCVGNISRSPMMEAVLQQFLGADFQVESAGVSRELAGRPANVHAVACLAERGIDLRAHVSRWVGQLELADYRWVVCVGQAEADSVRGLPGADPERILVANAEGGGVPDPYGLGRAGYLECLALLDRVLPQVTQRIRARRHGPPVGPPSPPGRGPAAGAGPHSGA